MGLDKAEIKKLLALGIMAILCIIITSFINEHNKDTEGINRYNRLVMENKNGDIILRDYLGNSEDIVISGEEVAKLVYVTSDGVVYYHNKKQDLMKIDTRDPEGINSPKKIMDSHYFESPEGYEADGFTSLYNEGNLQTAIVVDTAIQGIEGFRNYVIPVNQLTDDSNDLVFMTIDDKYGKGEYTMFVYDEDKDNVIEIDTINNSMPIYLDEKRNNLYYLKNYLNDENKDCKIMKLNKNLQPICIENLGVDYMANKGRSIAISRPFWLEYVFRKGNSLYYYDFTSFKCNKVCDINSEANVYIKPWGKFKNLDADNVEPIDELRENDYGNDDIIYIAEGYYLKKGGYEIPYKDIFIMDTADVSRQMMDIINNEVYIGYSVDLYKNGKLEEKDIMPFEIKEYNLQIDNNAFYVRKVDVDKYKKKILNKVSLTSAIDRINLFVDDIDIAKDDINIVKDDIRNRLDDIIWEKLQREIDRDYKSNKFYEIKTPKCQTTNLKEVYEGKNIRHLLSIGDRYYIELYEEGNRNTEIVSFEVDSTGKMINIKTIKTITNQGRYSIDPLIVGGYQNDILFIRSLRTPKYKMIINNREVDIDIEGVYFIEPYTNIKGDIFIYATLGEDEDYKEELYKLEDYKLTKVEEIDSLDKSIIIEIASKDYSEGCMDLRMIIYDDYIRRLYPFMGRLYPYSMW